MLQWHLTKHSLGRWLSHHDEDCINTVFTRIECKYFPHFTDFRTHITLYSKPRYEYSAIFFFSVLLKLAMVSFTIYTPKLIRGNQLRDGLDSVQCAVGGSEHENNMVQTTDKEEKLKQLGGVAKRKKWQRKRLGHHKTRSSSGMVLMAAAAAWATACVNASKALLCSTMLSTFQKCCLSNNIDVSVVSVFLCAVSVFLRALGCSWNEKAEIVLWSELFFPKYSLGFKFSLCIISMVTLFMCKYGM